MSGKLTASIDSSTNELVIRVPLNVGDDGSPKPADSKSGKTLVVASSYGNQQTELEVQGKYVRVGCNAYISKD